MNWFAIVLALLIGWLLGIFFDWFYWRLREVEGSTVVDCSDVTARYEGDLQELKLQLDRYKGDLSSRDAEIRSLNKSLETKELELGNLNVALGEREVEVEGLRGRLLGNMKSPGWFDWGEYDFFNWGEGDDVEFIGTGDAGGSVDVTYGGDVVGSADVDADGNWKLPWLVPGAFLPGLLGFIRRDRDGVEVDASRGEMAAAIDAKLPDVDVDASIPEVDVDVDVDAQDRRRWFNWGDWDFGDWGAGEEHELTGAGEPGGTVDVSYDGEFVGTAEVDNDGKWSFPFKVPALFAAGGLGLLSRNRDGVEVSASLPDGDIDLSGGVEVDASAPSVDVDVDAGGSRRWFNWGDWDFGSWREGETQELSGVGVPGGKVDVVYDGEVVGQADVDADGKWSFPWQLPAGFALGGLGFLGRDRDGVEVDGDVDLDIDASAPSVDVDVDADGRSRWFNWGDWDFGSWREGETQELSGVGVPGGKVDVVYDGEVVGQADVDADGKWRWPWTIPAGFALGGLSFLGRDSDGAEVDADADINLALAGGAAAGALAGGLAGAFVDLINDRTQTTIRLEDIEGDDLTKIWGIGPKTKLNFYRRGITTFEDFANIDEATLQEIMAESRLMSARIPKNPHADWTGLAALAAKGDWDGFDAMTVKIKPPEPERKKKRKKAIKLDGDKLSDISGIGRGTWKALHGMGYNSYAKLAGISVEEVEQAMKKSRALNAPGAPTPTEAHATWTELAGYAANEDWATFNARNAGVEAVITETISTPTRFDTLGYDFSDWEAGQQRSIYGREAAGSVINFFYDGQKVGDIVAGNDGAWEFPFEVPTGFDPSLMTFTMS